MKNLDSICKVVNLILKVIFLIMLAVFLLSKPATDKSSISHAYEVSTDVIVADEAAVGHLYVGEKEEHLQVYNIDISEDGKSLIIYKVDSEPIIFGGTANE